MTGTKRMKVDFFAGCLLAAAIFTTPAFALDASDMDADAIDWGDDTSNWSRDGECDDPRFEGAGMAGITYDVDAFRDAEDCRTLFEAGDIHLISEDLAKRPPLLIDGIQFGNDTSDWARDGECDDPRFSGEGMAHGELDKVNAYADRTDCLALWETGTLTYDPSWRAPSLPPPTAAEIDAVDFGADTSQWAQDDECDDPRFEGTGMAADPTLDDLKADATDCRRMYMLGLVTLRQKY